MRKSVNGRARASISGGWNGALGVRPGTTGSGNALGWISRKIGMTRSVMMNPGYEIAYVRNGARHLIF
jgi:hypothetical protein